MNAHTPEQIRQETRKYLVVFVALAGLTLLTVAASRMHVSEGMHVFVAMLIAVSKGSLVAAYFMHLIDERRVIYALLLLTMVFFVAIFFLPMGSFANQLMVR